ncbi:MAG: YidC/Oxa1 family membrane protein insertase [Lachnospiraceae bacterium]
MIIATKSGVPILGQIAVVLGWVMDQIYNLLDFIGIGNIGLCIILLTFVIYLLMTPLQIKQQKFSKLNAVMAPEIKKVQDKYKGKKDQVSMQKMQEETSTVYQKYGVSPTGSCLQLAIQMPILFALYQVIYKIPGYVGSVKGIFTGLITNIQGVDGFTAILQKFIEDNNLSRVSLVVDNNVASSDSIIDVLYALSPTQWDKLADLPKFSGFADTINSTADKLSSMQVFLGMNIADNPWNIITSQFGSNGTHMYWLAAVALMVPILAWFSQWISYKLMPQATTGSVDTGSMANTMKTMNNVMPIMSAVFCFTFPVGLGIYWIAGAVVRCIQQLVINKHLSKVDVDDLIKKNMEKAAKKREKAGLPPQKITNQAHQNVKKIDSTTKTSNIKDKNVEEKPVKYKEGSIAARARMVSQDDKGKKK